MQYLNDPHPWTGSLGDDLSLVYLVKNETIPAGPAALLWWAMERGASLLTAGGPSGAGKSTLANACLRFVPDGARAYVLAGDDDPLHVPTAGDDDPLHVPTDGDPTYLLVCEFSDHGRPFYLAGEPARRVLALRRGGVCVVGTLHADSVGEAIEVLGSEVGLSPEDIARVDLIAVTRVLDGVVKIEGRSFGRVPKEVPVQRRIVEIALLGPDSDGRVQSQTLATLGPTGQLEVAETPLGIAALARWAAVSESSAAAEIAARAEALFELSAGQQNPGDLDEAILRLRAS